MFIFCVLSNLSHRGGVWLVGKFFYFFCAFAISEMIWIKIVVLCYVETVNTFVPLCLYELWKNWKTLIFVSFHCFVPWLFSALSLFVMTSHSIRMQPAFIYDPRLTIGNVRQLAKKNLGKRHLVYFFECHDAPFSVLTTSKITKYVIQCMISQ